MLESMKDIEELIDFIDEMPDPRMEGKVQYALSAVVFITLCGILSGCESWIDIKNYGVMKESWLKKFVDLRNGIPSAWTFRRVFTLIDPDWVEELLTLNAKRLISKGNTTDQIAIDGKALRGSKREGVSCLQSVSAWCHENGLVLAEAQVEKKSNEIKAIPYLIDKMDLQKRTVSIDAAGCQKDIARKIKAKKGDYVLGLKQNHPKFYKAVVQHVQEQDKNDDNRLNDEFEDGHGRTVRRRYFGYDIKALHEAEEWEGAKSVIAVETISSRGNDPTHKVTSSWRYYLSSHSPDNKKVAEYIRNHWSIENKLHWVLDVHMREDDDQKAERRSVRSFALLKRIALNIVRTKDKTPKRSMKCKLKMAGWDNEYLLSLLT